jgi:hypothetical protein
METLVLGELISLKNTKFPWRNEGITKRGLGVTLTVVLMCVRERSEKNSEGVGKLCPGGLNP